MKIKTIAIILLSYMFMFGCEKLQNEKIRVTKMGADANFETHWNRLSYDSDGNLIAIYQENYEYEIEYDDKKKPVKIDVNYRSSKESITIDWNSEGFIFNETTVKLDNKERITELIPGSGRYFEYTYFKNDSAVIECLYDDKLLNKITLYYNDVFCPVKEIDIAIKLITKLHYQDLQDFTVFSEYIIGSYDFIHYTYPEYNQKTIYEISTNDDNFPIHMRGGYMTVYFEYETIE